MNCVSKRLPTAFLLVRITKEERVKPSRPLTGEVVESLRGAALMCATETSFAKLAERDGLELTNDGNTAEKSVLHKRQLKREHCSHKVYVLEDI